MILRSKIARRRKPMPPVITWTGPDTYNDQVAQLPADLADKFLLRFVIPDTENVKTMNYHPKIFRDSGGRVHLATTCHDKHESGPGSWCRYHYSDDDGTTWTESQNDLCPGLGVYSLEQDISSKRIPLPSLWVEIDGRVFCLVDAYNPPFEPDQVTYLLACEVVNGEPQTPGVVHPTNPTFISGFEFAPMDAQLASRMLREIRIAWGTPWAVGTADVVPYRPLLNEDVGLGSGLQKIQVDDGWIVYARAGTVPGETAIHWAFCAFSYDGINFSEWVQSPFPNGRSKIVIKKISNGYLALTHNQNTRNPIIAARSHNGRDWTALELVHDAFHMWEHRDAYDADGDGDWQEFYKQYYDGVGTFSTSPNWDGTAKGGGPSYHDFCELPNGQILCAFGERGKEVIGVVRWTPKSLT